MDCSELNIMLDAYIDGELDTPSTVRIESHVQTCLACQRKLRAQMDLRAAIKTSAPYFKAPESLRNKIHAELHKQEKSWWRASLNTWHWPTIGAMAASVVLLSSSLLLLLNTPSTEDLLLREVVAGHVRSLMAEHLTDVRSTDRHTVKPWFNGQLNFAPPVHDLAAQGFALLGGRLDYVNNRQAAALVYQYRKHIINLFIWPIDTQLASRISEKSWQGYSTAAWNQAGMRFWAVSDLNENGLNEFALLLQSANATQSQ